MKNRHLKILIFFLFSAGYFYGQMPTCPSPYVFMDGPNGIHAYNPALPLSATNPSPIGIPNGGGGLTLMPNINGGTLSPTFYSIIGGNYSYWSGTAWVSTGHSAGNGAAVNLGGCNSAIYNLVGGTGQVYVYNGTGNGSLLTTISGFNGGGPYDLVTDCFCNFYVLNTTTPNQNLTLYSPAGAVLCSYSLSGMPNASAGGGFAIIGNTIYVKNNLANGFFVGTIAGSTVTFTNLVGFSLGPGDFASCPVCVPSATLNNATISGGALGCLVPTINVIANTTATPVTYNWSGPGIVGPTTNSAIVVNSTGIFTCVISANGCPASQLTLTTTIISSVIPVFTSITPSGNICMTGSTPIPLNVTASISNSTALWTGPGMPLPVSGSSITANATGLYSVAVTDFFTGCVGASTVNIIQTPTVSLSLSTLTLCAQPIGNSLATITLTPSGANNYTLLTSAGYSTSSPNGTIMPCTPTPPFVNAIVAASATLIGANNICTDTTMAIFSIYPNPNVNITPSNTNICFGTSDLLIAFGANQYTWSPLPGLSSYTSNIVVASPTVSSIYTVTGSSNSCISLPKTATVNVLPLPVFSISPSSTLICLGAHANLTAVGNANTYAWSPVTGLSSASGVAIISTPSVSQTYQVIGTLNTCTSVATTTVNVLNPPTLSLTLSQPSLCAQNLNGSPNSLTATPSGATSYTMLNGSNYSANTPNGPIMQIFPAGALQAGLSVATITLLGSSSVCTMVTTHTFAIVPNPTVFVSPQNTGICLGKSQIYTATGADNYNWFPLSNLSAYTGSLVISVTPTVSTLYSVIGNSSGCFSATKNANLILLPTPSVSLSPQSSTVCAGNSMTIHANGSANSFTWMPATNLSSPFGNSVIATPSVTQVYTVIASLNSCTNTAQATVSTIAVPIVSVSASDRTICSAANTNIQASGASSFSWSPISSLNVPVGPNVIANPISNTTYTILGFNGTCTGSNTIQIYTVPRPNMSITATSNQVCIGYSLPIIVEGAQNYSWTPIYGLSSTTGSLVHASPLITTNYTVYGSNSNGTISCFQLLSYSVIVTPFAHATTSGSVALCLGDKATLYASGGTSYSWTPGTGLNISNASAVVAGPTVSTVYSVEVSYNTFCGNTATVLVEVNPKPTVFAGRDTTYNIDEPIYIEAVGTGTLNWISGEDIMCPNCPITRIFPTKDECYVVETQNEYGCRAQDKVCIDVTNDFTIYIPNTFTPNKDGINDVFYVVGNGITSITMEIYNRWGQLLFLSHDQLQGWDGSYNGANCAVGVYNYRVEYTGLNGKRYIRTGNININK